MGRTVPANKRAWLEFGHLRIEAVPNAGFAGALIEIVRADADVHLYLIQVVLTGETIIDARKDGMIFNTARTLLFPGDSVRVRVKNDGAAVTISYGYNMVVFDK